MNLSFDSNLRIGGAPHPTDLDGRLGDASGGKGGSKDGSKGGGGDGPVSNDHCCVLYLLQLSTAII